MQNIITSLLLVSIFKNVIEDEIVVAFIDFLVELNKKSDFEIVINKYTNFITKFYKLTSNLDFYSYVKNLIYTDENIISKGCSNCIKDDEKILETASFELSSLYSMLSVNYDTISKILIEEYPQKAEFIVHLPIFYTNFEAKLDLDDLIKFYQNSGYGVFSCYSAFEFTSEKEIKPVKYFDNLKFSDLKNYEYQKDVIKKNTLAFLNGKEANNILLYGDRGCGKSSTVKALLSEFSDFNLKIIQVYKESIINLSYLFEKLRNLPNKFIIFADDISFEENDKNFSSIKAVLEGSLSNKPKNVVIYATTNRMHLVKESFSSRTGNEVHCNDTIDETVSLSDRFGIMLTFSILTKSEYLDIVSKIANDCCVTVDENLYRKAEEFSSLKGIRTPRVARQFITDYIANME